MSSSMVYGNFDSEDVKEERACKPIGIYGTLKYSGELLVKAYSDIFDLLLFNYKTLSFVWREVCK